MFSQPPHRSASAWRVLHITPLYFNQRSCLGGGERYPLNIARGTVKAARGAFTVDVVSFDDLPVSRIIEPGVTLRLLPAANHADPLNVLSWELPAAIAEADLVHIHQVAMRASEFALLVAKHHGKPVCVTDHGSTSSGCGVFADRLELADRIICYSDYGASILETATPIEIIKGGVDTEFFCPPPSPVHRRHILYVGRLVPYKSADLLIQALPPDLPLVICGQPFRQDYFLLLKNLAKGKNVRFVLGAQDEELRELYRTAWVTVLPSRYEDCYGNIQPMPELMGLSLLESMACATPAICNRAGGMPEFVSHGKTGFVFDKSAELTAQLRLLAENAALAEKMGLDGRKLVEKEFDYRLAGEKLMQVYQELLESRQARTFAA